MLQWIAWDPNEAIDIGEWSICAGGQTERFHCINTAFIDINTAFINTNKLNLPAPDSALIIPLLLSTITVS